MIKKAIPHFVKVKLKYRKKSQNRPKSGQFSPKSHIFEDVFMCFWVKFLPKLADILMVMRQKRSTNV